MIQYSRDYVLEYLKNEGYTDCYAALGDTDGVGIAVPSASTRHEAMDVISDAVTQLNGEGYDDFFHEEMGVPPRHHHGEIEIESYAPKVFVPSQNPPHGEIGRKKRYIQWETWNDDDGECDELSVTGLEYVRSDVAPITKAAQWEFAKTLRMDDGEAREQLFPILREMAEGVKGGTVELDHVCKRGGIGQSLSEYGTATRRASTFYRGAKYANQNIDGVTIQHGDKPRLVYVKDVRGQQYPSVYDAETAEDGDPVDAVTLPNPSKLPDDFVIDWDEHWTKALKEPLEPLLETRFGGDVWSEIIHDHEQCDFSRFA
jgi:DNA polymerase I